MKKVAIVQSNYIPWKGYFDLIASVDEFILFDDMQYTRRDWRNRNQIKTSQGLKWLSVPVKVKGKYFQSIRETEIDGNDWARKHWKTLEHNYRHAPYFDSNAPWLASLYKTSATQKYLSPLNRMFLEGICQQLGIITKMSNSWDYQYEEGKSERLASLCEAVGGSVYVSGPAAKSYIDETVFQKKKIKVEWINYSGYFAYTQLWGKFEHNVSILDVIFNCGPNSLEFLKKKA